MAPTRINNTVLSALDSKQQTPTQAFTQDFPSTANPPRTAPAAPAATLCLTITADSTAHVHENQRTKDDAVSVRVAERTGEESISAPSSTPLGKNSSPVNESDACLTEVNRDSEPAPVPAQRSTSWEPTSPAPSALMTPPSSPSTSSSSAASSTSASTSLLGRVRRSSFLEFFMAERAVKADLILPPPIYRVYQFIEETGQRTRHHTAPSATIAQDRTPIQRVVRPAQGDVYNFTFSRRKTAQLQATQRRYFQRQRASPHAPQLIHLDDVANTLLHEDEIAGTVTNAEDGYADDVFDPGMTTSERVAELLSVFCTRGIPQGEYIDAVFHHRMCVLRKTCKAVPVGVVVPSLVRPTMRLSDAVATRQCLGNTSVSAVGEKEKAASEPLMAHRNVVSEPRVTYPHPGTPYTFEDLARDPGQLSAEQRVERRAALLHRRTLSEDVYGVPTPYL